MNKINITKHETQEISIGVKHIIHDGKIKYEFLENKKDGGETKAFEQYKKLELGLGSQVYAEVKEDPVTFTNQQGKEINFTRRTILWFDDNPSNAPTPGSSGYDFSGMAKDSKLRELEERIKALEDTIVSSGIGDEDEIRLDF